MSAKDKIIAALEKDIKRRYIGVSTLQADGRLELGPACISILQPNDGEQFSIIDDSSSIIIVRNPMPQHVENVIATTVWDSKKKRLRLSQNVLRILLTCTVGFRVFKYGDEIALEAEPYIKPQEISSDIEFITDLNKYVLRSARSVYHLNIFFDDQEYYPFDFKFRLVGEYWIRRHHQDPLDVSFKKLVCVGQNCIYCNNKLPIVNEIFWLPILTYNDYPRPGLISVRSSALNVVKPLIDECNKFTKSCFDIDVKPFCQNGNVTFGGNKLFSAKTNKRNHLIISDICSDDGFSIDEKGLLKLSLKDMESLIRTTENGD